METEITVAGQLQNRTELEQFLDQAKTLEDSVLVECFPSTESTIHFSHEPILCFDLTFFESPRLFRSIHGNMQWCFLRTIFEVQATYTSTFITCEDITPVEKFVAQVDSSEQHG